MDDTHWPANSALIDEACGIAGNALLVGEGPQDDIRVFFVGLYSHSRHFLATTNPGSDWKVLKALALAVLQLWPLAAGSLQTQPAPLLGHPPQLRLR